VRPARGRRRRALRCRPKLYPDVRGAHAPILIGMPVTDDRLARSTFDLFAIVKQIVDAKAQFRSLAEP
jgi:hypothetical protein